MLHFCHSLLSEVLILRKVEQKSFKSDRDQTEHRDESLELFF